MNGDPYPHPLHSFLFIPDMPARTREPQPHQLVVPAGVLVVRGGLIRLARRVPTSDCLKAVGLSLDVHQGLVETFVPYGLGRPWADAMRHWSRQLADLEARRVELAARIGLQTRFRQRHGDVARKLWQRLNQAGKLAGLSRPLVRGRAPRAEADLVTGLQHVLPRLDDPGTAQLLAHNGFGPGERGLLVETLAQLAPIAQGVFDKGVARGETMCAVLVVRGALLGDLSRFASLARTAGLDTVTRSLAVPILLRSPIKWRRAKPAPRPEPEP